MVAVRVARQMPPLTFTLFKKFVQTLPYPHGFSSPGFGWSPNTYDALLVRNSSSVTGYPYNLDFMIAAPLSEKPTGTQEGLEWQIFPMGAGSGADTQTTIERSIYSVYSDTLFPSDPFIKYILSTSTALSVPFPGNSTNELYGPITLPFNLNFSSVTLPGGGLAAGWNVQRVGFVLNTGTHLCVGNNYWHAFGDPIINFIGVNATTFAPIVAPNLDANSNPYPFTQIFPICNWYNRADPLDPSNYILSLYNGNPTPLYWYITPTTGLNGGNPGYIINYEDPSYNTGPSMNINPPVSLCPMGFLIQPNYNNPSLRLHILSPDGSMYWPINVQAGDADAALQLQQVFYYFKIDIDGNMWYASNHYGLPEVFFGLPSTYPTLTLPTLFLPGFPLACYQSCRGVTIFPTKSDDEEG